MVNFIKRNWFKIALLLVAIFTVKMYFDNSSEKESKAELAKNYDMQHLQLCLDNARSGYTVLISSNSNADGSYKSLEAQKFVESKYANEKDDCFKQYPQN